MANAVSQALREAMYSQTTERVPIIMAEVSSPQLVNTIYLARDANDVTHGGNTYMGFPFNVIPPEDSQETQPVARFSMPNVGLEFVAALRGIRDPANVKFFIVLDSSPETVELGPWDMLLTDVRYDINTIEGSLRPNWLYNEPFPFQVFNGIDYPGL